MSHAFHPLRSGGHWGFGFVLLSLLLGSHTLPARLSATHWRTNPDSLRRVPASQHTATTRARTLQLLINLDQDETSDL